MNDILQGEGFVLLVPALLILILLKPLATAFSVGSGGGGTFGAIVGALFARSRRRRSPALRSGHPEAGG